MAGLGQQGLEHLSVSNAGSYRPDTGKSSTKRGRLGLGLRDSPCDDGVIPCRPLRRFDAEFAVEVSNVQRGFSVLTTPRMGIFNLDVLKVMTGPDSLDYDRQRSSSGLILIHFL